MTIAQKREELIHDEYATPNEDENAVMDDREEEGYAPTSTDGTNNTEMSEESNQFNTNEQENSHSEENINAEIDDDSQVCGG